MIQFIVSMIRSRHRKMVKSDFHEFQMLEQFPGWTLLFFSNFSHVPLSIYQNSTKINKMSQIRVNGHFCPVKRRQSSTESVRSMVGQCFVNSIKWGQNHDDRFHRRFFWNDHFRSLPATSGQSEPIKDHFKSTNEIILSCFVILIYFHMMVYQIRSDWNEVLIVKKCVQMTIFPVPSPSRFVSNYVRQLSIKCPVICSGYIPIMSEYMSQMISKNVNRWRFCWLNSLTIIDPNDVFVSIVTFLNKSG